MSQRRILPAAPFWAMLAAVWALLVLGAVPPRPHDALCGTAGQRHGPGHNLPDCLACCPCTLSGGAVHALASADAPALPPPRGGTLGAGPVLSGTAITAAVPPLPRARAPPFA